MTTKTTPTKIIKEFRDRVETYNANGQLHSFNDYPAIKFHSGEHHWYNAGKLHRANGKLPAIIAANGVQKFYINGVEVNAATKAAAIAKIKEYDENLEKMRVAALKLRDELAADLGNWVNNYKNMQALNETLLSERNNLARSHAIDIKYTNINSVDDVVNEVAERYVYLNYNSSNC